MQVSTFCFEVSYDIFSIFQTLKGKFALLGIVAKQAKPFSRRTAIYAITGLIEKLGDLKVCDLLFII